MVKYNGKWIEECEAWDIMDDMRAKVAKKKVYEFEYSYNRYNPQLGTSERTSTVLACNESEAVRKATASCKKYKAYGSLSFIGLTGNKKLLQNDVDFRWNIRLEDVHGMGYFGTKKIVKELEKIY